MHTSQKNILKPVQIFFPLIKKRERTRKISIQFFSIPRSLKNQNKINFEFKKFNLIVLLFRESEHINDRAATDFFFSCSTQCEAKEICRSIHTYIAFWERKCNTLKVLDHFFSSVLHYTHG